METYTHFGKQPDILKHLVLCEVLQIEKPQIYVETNSACAIYTMAHTPEQEYGIYHFLNEANEDDILKNSLYYQLESESMANGYYLGSPALAMKVLNDVVGHMTCTYSFSYITLFAHQLWTFRLHVIIKCNLGIMCNLKYSALYSESKAFKLFFYVF